MNHATTVNFELTQGLHNAFKGVIMPLTEDKRYCVMKKEQAVVTNPFPDDPEEFMALWTEGAVRAADNEQKKASDLGLDVPLAHKGRRSVLKPDGSIIAVKSFDHK